MIFFDILIFFGCEYGGVGVIEVPVVCCLCYINHETKTVFLQDSLKKKETCGARSTSTHTSTPAAGARGNQGEGGTEAQLHAQRKPRTRTGEGARVLLRERSEIAMIPI